MALPYQPSAVPATSMAQTPAQTSQYQMQQMQLCQQLQLLQSAHHRSTAQQYAQHQHQHPPRAHPMQVPVAAPRAQQLPMPLPPHQPQHPQQMYSQQIAPQQLSQSQQQHLHTLQAESLGLTTTRSAGGAQHSVPNALQHSMPMPMSHGPGTAPHCLPMPHSTSASSHALHPQGIQMASQPQVSRYGGQAHSATSAAQPLSRMAAPYHQPHAMVPTAGSRSAHAHASPAATTATRASSMMPLAGHSRVSPMYAQQGMSQVAGVPGASPRQLSNAMPASAMASQMNGASHAVPQPKYAAAHQKRDLRSVAGSTVAAEPLPKRQKVHSAGVASPAPVMPVPNVSPGNFKLELWSELAKPGKLPLDSTLTVLDRTIADFVQDLVRATLSTAHLRQGEREAAPRTSDLVHLLARKPRYWTHTTELLSLYEELKRERAKIAQEILGPEGTGATSPHSLTGT